MSDNKFAFGMNHCDGTDCPAVTAGYDPSDYETIILVVDTFDYLVSRREEVDGKVGVVDEEVAKEEWNRAIEKVSNGLQSDDETVVAGKEVAEELNWT